MKLKFYALFVTLSFSFLLTKTSTAQHTAAREWNETLLFAISADFARPTVHARNLFHASIIMYDCWAVYEEGAQTYLVGQNLNGYNGSFRGAPYQADKLAAQEEALSFAMYRLISHRYSNSPGVFAITDSIQNLMESKGYDYENASIDYLGGGPAEMGNHIAKLMIGYGFADGANEGGNYANQFYTPLNAPIEVEEPGNPDIVDPNRWQQITLSESIDQSGEIVANTPDFLSPEWGEVYPFSMTDDNLSILNRDDQDFKVYHDPGPPALLDVNNPGGMEDPYKWNFMLVPIWQSHLSTNDDEIWDISPASIGNISEYPDNQAEMESFYNLFEGGDPGQGYNLNPITGLPYTPQLVKRADYARVLAEFWADGPNSVTPPGHWFDLLNGVMDHPGFEKSWMGIGQELSDLEYDVKAYFAMGGAMHDAAIAAWSIKGFYDYLRPVSAVRYMADQGQCSDENEMSYNPLGVPLIPGYVELVEVGDPLAGISDQHVGKIKLYTWKGPDYIEDPETDQAGVGWILAENWWPYQRPSFVTPPFAGYLSGHSTYSRTAAELMTLMTGSAFFPGGMSGYEVEQNDFLVFEEGPSQTLTLQWATYRDASDQCSLSRIWGGIHPPVDDIPGRKIGMELGPEAFDFADNIVNGSQPYVESLVFSQDTLNTEDVGAPFSITINFSENMNTSLIPLITFFNDDPTLEALSFDDAYWVSPTAYVFNYDFVGSNVEFTNIIFNVSSAISALGKPHIPYASVRDIFIDSKKPLLSIITPAYETINDVSIEEQSFTISFTMDEACNNQGNTPIISFESGSDISASISHNSSLSEWTDENTYLAHFTLNDIDIEVENIGVQISNITDLFGNPFIETLSEDVFNIDSKNPSASDIEVNNSSLVQTDQGSSALIVEITFDEPMNMDESPELTFSNEDPLANSLIYNTLNSFWVSDTQCQVAYDLLLSGEEMFNIVVSLESFKDLVGNDGVEDLGETLFTIDTKTPEVTDINYSTQVISDQNVGAEGFEILVEFSEEMNFGETPLVSVTGSTLNGTLQYQIGMSYWENETTFKAIFEVTDENIETETLSVLVQFAEDASGNSQTPFTASQPFAVDMLNPMLVSTSASDYTISDENIGENGLNIIMVFDEEMDQLVMPTFTFIPEEPATSILSVNTDSEWLNPYTYIAEFDVADAQAVADNITVNIGQGQDLAGNNLNNEKLLEFLSIALGTVGIDDLYGSEVVSFYPSPIQTGANNITMNTTNAHSNVVIRLFDAKGQLVLIKSYGQLQPGTKQIDLPYLSEGLYIVDFKSDDSIQNSKIIVH